MVSLFSAGMVFGKPSIDFYEYFSHKPSKGKYHVLTATATVKHWNTGVEEVVKYKKYYSASPVFVIDANDLSDMYILKRINKTGTWYSAVYQLKGKKSEEFYKFTREYANKTAITFIDGKKTGVFNAISVIKDGKIIAEMLSDEAISNEKMIIEKFGFKVRIEKKRE